MALQNLDNIFRTTITKKPISALRVPDIAPPPPPPHLPQTRSQTKKFANAAITPPQNTHILQTQAERPIHQHKDTDPFHEMFPEPTIDITLHHKPCIVLILANLRPKYPTKH